eukprot:scaffold6387_cov19-Tisochrysis_lutea.AAC.1
MLLLVSGLCVKYRAHTACCGAIYWSSCVLRRFCCAHVMTLNRMNREGVKAIADKGGEEFKAIFVDRNVDSETEPLTALDGTSVTVEATMPDPT